MEINWLFLSLLLLLLSGIALLALKLHSNQKKIDSFRGEIESLRKNLEIFNDGAVGIGKRLVEAERQLSTVASDQAQLLQQTADISYTQANEMIEAGADIDDLMRKCGLPRAEAELMLLINRQLRE